MTKKKIIIGTRGSELALWQANFVKSELEARSIEVELKIIKTQGDEITHLSLEKLEGKGFFTKEIEQALLNSEIDLAVHSFKDLPTESPQGLSIAAITKREDASELLIIRNNKVDISKPLSLKENAIVGSSSNRRKAQLLALRPDVKLKDLRGNVPTRIQKLEKANYDAIMLAKAGIKRLNIDLSKFHVVSLDPHDFITAPAQGALALQIREHDIELKEILSFLHHEDSATCIGVERAILSAFGGGCHMPLGCYCIKEDKHYKVWVSQTETFEEFPCRIFKTSSDAQKLPSLVLESYQKIKSKSLPKSIFISRKLESHSYISKVASLHNIKIEAQSLIKLYPIVHSLDNYLMTKTDWIFFNSKNGLDIFFSLKLNIPSNIKFATVGKGSAEALRKYGYEASFIGNNIKPEAIAESVAPLMEGQTVLFPRAKDSLQSIQKNLPSSVKVMDLPLYQTVILPNASASACEVLIFTSPSNAEAYFTANLLEPNQKVIAIGTSTGKKLSSIGINEYLLPATPDEVGIAEVLLSM